MTMRRKPLDWGWFYRAVEKTLEPIRPREASEHVTVEKAVARCRQFKIDAYKASQRVIRK